MWRFLAFSLFVVLLIGTLPDACAKKFGLKGRVTIDRDASADGSAQSALDGKKGGSNSATGSTHYDRFVKVKTSKGDFRMQIYGKDAPITSDNFLDLIRRGFYNGLTFHRYEPGFVIQGGCPKGDGSGDFIEPKSHQTRRVKLEKIPNLRHVSAGIVAMARASDPDSGSCQWYITLAPAEFLDQPPGYAVFGRVVEGLDTVMKLRRGDKMQSLTIENDGAETASNQKNVKLDQPVLNSQNQRRKLPQPQGQKSK